MLLAISVNATLVGIIGDLKKAVPVYWMAMYGMEQNTPQNGPIFVLILGELPCERQQDGNQVSRHHQPEGVSEALCCWRMQTGLLCARQLGIQVRHTCSASR